MTLLDSVTVIIVTHNSAGVIEKCLEALVANDIRIIIVDNASTDETRNMVRNISSKIHLIESSVNAGYGAGNNIGLKACETAYAMILNPDIVPSIDSIARLTMQMKNDPELVMVGPLLLDADGTPNPYAIAKSLPIESKREEVVNQKIACEVDWISGAAFLYRTSMIQHNRLYDEKIFLYYEDDDLCQRLRSGKRRLVLDCSVQMTHDGSRSSLMTDRYRYRKAVHMNWSRLYLIKKNHGSGYAFWKGMVLLCRAWMGMFWAMARFHGVDFRERCGRARGAWLSLLGLGAFQSDNTPRG